MIRQAAAWCHTSQTENDYTKYKQHDLTKLFNFILCRIFKHCNILLYCKCRKTSRTWV